jgi:hypothetical protein
MNYPHEEIQKQLEAAQIPRSQQDYDSLKNLLSAYFKLDKIDPPQDVNELAEIIVYLIKKNLVKTER